MRTLLFLIFSLPFATQAAVTAFEVGPGNTDQLPKGKEADGIIGDFILRNDYVTAVISGNQPLRRANMSTFYGTGGNGFQPNKDTLGWPLPLGRQDPAKIRALLKARGN